MRPISINRLPFYIAVRYSFSRQRNRFIGVVAMVSLLGMALGVASLITVLSIMNGFADELRGRILSLVPHAQVQSQAGSLDAWQPLSKRVATMSGVEGVAPYVDAKVLISSDRQTLGAQMIAIDPQLEAGVSKVSSRMIEGNIDTLNRQRWGIVLGSLLSRSLGVGLDDKVQLVAPNLTNTPLGSMPRSKRFTVVGIFEVGAQLDSTHAFIALKDGQALMGLGEGVAGLRIAYEDLYLAPAAAKETAAALGPEYRVLDWGQSNQSLFSAVKMEKTMITMLLLSVVAVAAFNIVSTLTMAVTEKRSDIAVLRTMGTGRGGVTAIFVCQGMLLSLIGISAGAILGALIAVNIADISLFLENIVGVQLFDPRVYFISHLPSRLAGADVFLVFSLALMLSFLATLVPAWRASTIHPAEVLRYE